MLNSLNFAVTPVVPTGYAYWEFAPCGCGPGSPKDLWSRRV